MLLFLIIEILTGVVIYNLGISDYGRALIVSAPMLVLSSVLILTTMILIKPFMPVLNVAEELSHFDVEERNNDMGRELPPMLKKIVKKYPYLATIIDNEIEKRSIEFSERQTALAKEEIENLTNTFNEVHEKLDNYTKELEEEVEKRTKAIRDQQMMITMTSKLAALGEMAGGIAHEINNPLAIISGNCNYLRRTIESNQFDPKVVAKRLNDVELTTKRISKIVRGLKTISRDATKEEYTSVKIKDLFEEVIDLCAEKMKHSQVKLIINWDDPVFEQYIECRQVQISQTLLNLIGNAFDAIEDLDEKWIHIECQNMGTKMEFRIIDSGNGIPMNIQEKIFQPFFTTKEVGKRTGLGLSISNSIIMNHEGEFYIDNAYPSTCFVIVLPIVHRYLKVHA